MIRIILRCFLVLAFTVVLLSTAQETSSVSDASHPTPQSSEASSSAPETSSVSVGEPSSFSPVDTKTVDESSSQPTAAATSGSSNPGVTTNAVDDRPSESTSDSEHVKDSTTITKETESSEEENTTASLPSVSHSEGLYKSEIQDAESTVAETSSEKLPGPSDKSVVNDSENEVLDEKGQKVSNTSTTDKSNKSVTGGPDTTAVTSTVSEEAEITTAVAFQSTAASSPENATNYSGQSSVPSKEESVYNSSYVDKNQSPEEMSSTIPSKVQTEENETNGSAAKSATRKRSLNATNTMTTSTTAVTPEDVSTSTPADTNSKYTTPPSETSNARTRVSIDSSSAEVLTTMKQPVSAGTSNVDLAAMESKVVTAVHDMETEVTNFPHTINSALPNTGVSVAHFHEPEHATELASSGYHQHEAHMLPMSLAALSTLSEESIHPFESIGTTAQISNDRRGVSTASSDPQRSPELEIESAAPVSHSYFSVTFDPDGMTHNLPQDPDSVTFSPGVFHVDGMPTDRYMSRLEHEESFSHKPEKSHSGFTERATNLPEVLGSSSFATEGSHPFERERETASSSSHALFPHDEPDFEEMHSRSSTKHPAEVSPLPTGGSFDVHTFGTPDTSKIILPLNDESEEMLNDSPHFVHIQSKSTVTPTAEVKNEFVSKDLEMNVSNDITHAKSPIPQNTPETVNELDFSTEHHRTAQSEIRPVTAVSPLKISESTTFLPVSIVSHSQPDEMAKSGQPEATLPDTSSPSILSNPAPIIANQSAETTTVVLQPDIAAQSNASELEWEQENVTATVNNTTTTIAGLAVKTSVSVSLPLSNIPNDTMNSTVIQARDDVNVSSNVSEVILSLPIPISKDASGHPAPTVASTEAPIVPPSPATTESSRPRIRKPKLKFSTDSDDEPVTPRTRKPYVPPHQRASTTVGPPVSIFKKARTRLASITSSTTARPLPKFSTIRIQYASRIPGMVPGGELVISTEPITTTIPTTTETEEPFSDEPFTEQTQGPIVPSEDDVTLVKVAGYIVVTKGLRWNDQLNNRLTPQYKEKAKYVQVQLDRLFRTSPIASQLWRIQIDGFSVKGNPPSVAIDFFLYLIKTPNEVTMEQLTTVFHDKLKNNTFSRFTVDTNKTSFERLNYESMKPTTEPPEQEEPEPVLPQWAIAVIVVGAASLIFIVLFAAVAILGRHHVRRRYSSKLNDEDSDRPSDWESKMAAAYENLAADTIYDAEDMPSDTYKKRFPNSTYNGRPSRPRRADSWSSSDWSPPPRRPRPQVHRLAY